MSQLEGKRAAVVGLLEDGRTEPSGLQLLLMDNGDSVYSSGD